MSTARPDVGDSGAGPGGPAQQNQPSGPTDPAAQGDRLAGPGGPAQGESARPPLWIAGAGIVFGFLAAIFLQLFVQLGGSAFGSPFAHPTPAVSLLSDVAFDLSFVGAALYFAVLGGGMRAPDFGYRRIRWRTGILAFVLAGGGYYIVTDLYATLLSLRGTDRLPSELGTTQHTAALVGSALFVCVIAPVCEEFFFRGFLFGVLRRLPVRLGGRDLGPWVAAVLVGILFGLAHSGSALSEDLIPLGFLGFVLCLVRWRTGSLYPCMALHSFNNSLALGVNELGWAWWKILLLAGGSFLVLAVLTLPLSRPGGRGVLGRLGG